MKILVRHLFMNLLIPLLYLLLVFTLLFVIADLMENAYKFLGAETPSMVMIRYFGLRLPSLVIFIVPVCLLLATLYSLSMLTRHNEIVAMRASGISIYRIVRPYLFMGFICFCFTAIVNEVTGPRHAYRADQILLQQKMESDEVFFEKIPFENPTARHSWYIESFDTRTYTMRGITLRQLREDGSDEIKITARKGQWLDNRWWFEDGAIQRYNKNNDPVGTAEPFLTREMRNLPEIPEDFMGEAKPAEYQSSLELRKYIATHQFLSPETLNKYEVDFHHKLTMPFICIIATLIGIPVGAHTGRKGALAGILLAIGSFFGFYALQFTMEYFAKQMILAPWAGAWTAVIVFSVIGAVEIHRMR